LSIPAAAQVTAPLLGWLPDGSGIRPMNGLPAAATLGSVVNVGHALGRMAVSPAQNYVLAVASDTHQVLLIVPGVSATPLNVPANPDQIVVSPAGSAAALWYSSSSQFVIVSGLPGSSAGSPATQQINASFTPAAFAVSDDGLSIAAASSNGAYVLGAGGSSQLVYSGGDAGALAFFAGNKNLVLAGATQLLSITNSGGGATTSVLAQGTYSPAGIAVSSDNQKIVFADQSGSITSIAAGSGASTTFNCQCRADGVFGLGHEVFRLTSSTMGPVKLFDASAGAVVAVPRANLNPQPAVRPAQTTATLPTLSISLSPFPDGYLQQPSMTVTASAPYSAAITGTVTLAFASANAGEDQAIQFSSGGTTVNFTIPAGSTQANFSGSPSVTLSTGTTAGTTTLTAAITAPTAVASAATLSFTTNPTVPFISSVSFTDTPGIVTVVITGFSSTRNVAGAAFTFAPSSNATINESNSISQPEVSVSVSFYFEPWYATATSYATGSEFTLTVPFSVTGNSNDIVSVSVTLVNAVGASNPASPNN
jgi:hypothetical protein